MKESFPRKGFIFLKIEHPISAMEFLCIKIDLHLQKDWINFLSYFKIYYDFLINTLLTALLSFECYLNSLFFLVPIITFRFVFAVP